MNNIDTKGLATWIHHYNQYVALINQLRYNGKLILCYLGAGLLCLFLGLTIMAAANTTNSRLGHGVSLGTLAISVVLLGVSGSLFVYRHAVQLPQREQLYQRLEREAKQVTALAIMDQYTVYMNKQHADCGPDDTLPIYIYGTPKYPAIVLNKGYFYPMTLPSKKIKVNNGKSLVLIETNDRRIKLKTMKHVNAEQLANQVVKEYPQGFKLSKQKQSGDWLCKHLQRLPQELNAHHALASGTELTEDEQPTNEQNN